MPFYIYRKEANAFLSFVSLAGVFTGELNSAAPFDSRQRARETLRAFCKKHSFKSTSLDVMWLAFPQISPVPKPSDPIHRPPHYTSHPSGIECIDVVEHFGFSLGNAIKYIWRADLKDNALEDLQKARWYISREIERRKKAAAK